MHCPSSPAPSNYPNITCRKTDNCEAAIVSYHPLPPTLCYKHPPQHTVLQHPWSMLFPQCDQVSHPHIIADENYSFVYSILRLFRQAKRYFHINVHILSQR